MNKNAFLIGSDITNKLIEDIKNNGLNNTIKQFKVVSFDIEYDGCSCILFDNGLKLIIGGDIYDYDLSTLSYDLQNGAGESIIESMRSDENVTSWYDNKIKEQTKPGYFKN